MNRIRTLDYH